MFEVKDWRDRRPVHLLKSGCPVLAFTPYVEF